VVIHSIEGPFIARYAGTTYPGRRIKEELHR
jgi:hypothetical protein